MSSSPLSKEDIEIIEKIFTDYFKTWTRREQALHLSFLRDQNIISRKIVIEIFRRINEYEKSKM